MSNSTTEKKWEIFMMLLAKAPIVQALDDEEGLTEEGQATIGQIVRDVHAATDCVWNTLLDINTESKKPTATQEKRSAR